MPIIITTLQKFPFVSGQLMKLAEERGEGSKSHLPTRSYAVIIDEAHSSQSGETATELKGVLGGAELRRKAQEMAEEEGELELERLFRSMAKRGQQPNISFFAFTATPKHKTLAIFGRKGEPFHRYTMRQAIEEGFIEDVLKSYVTYKTYYKLIKKAEDDPNVERKKAAKALARFMRLHPHNIGQKTEVMVEHFQHFTRHKIGGHAKAMVVTGSRLEAVRYKQEFDRYIEEKGYPIKSLVAFSGSVEDDRIAEKTYTEVEMNGGLKEKALPETFAKPEFRVLLVAEKYQTGFDQPLLHTMYVDKRLAGIQAVQTLSRLNRTHPLKDDTFVLDFVNEPGEIQEPSASITKRGDGGGGRSRQALRGEGRARCLGHLPSDRGERFFAGVLRAQAPPEPRRPQGDERGPRSGGRALRAVATHGRGGSRAVARQAAGLPQSVRLSEPGDSVSGQRSGEAVRLPAPPRAEAAQAQERARLPVR